MSTATLRTDVSRNFIKKRMVSFGALAAIVAYFIYIFFAFDILGLSERARLDNAAKLVADSYSYNTHVTKLNRGDGSVAIATDGDKKGRYPEGHTPKWVQIDGHNLQVELKNNHVVSVAGKVVLYDVPNYGLIEVTPRISGVELKLPTLHVPDFINASKSRVTITTDGGRVSVTKTKTEIFRRSFGWEFFFFTLDSPFYGTSFGELFGLAVSPERVDPEQSNIAAMLKDFWTNSMWLHRDVAWAMYETVLMAFLGTIGAAMIALPLAFISANNFTPSWLARFSMRRVFDFLRGVDGLIWTIVLARAFGPGPMTGALAILLTDTGTFGKMFSETLENIDEKQIEGVRSTGAKPIQRYRFGVIPQITPVFVSQVLYYMESNTRSATVIGAIVGGGIGLLLTQAIITGKDWEEVTYYIVLIVLMVMMMDSISGWLRRKLIGEKEA
jgi:phosphonate transport system permease protein